MEIARLDDLHQNIEKYYEQLAGKEEAYRVAPQEEKVRIQQQIDLIWKDIHKYENEYALRLSQSIKKQDLPELIAQEVTAELVDELELLTPQTQNKNIKIILLKILEELQQPELPVSAKLKAAIPLIPGILAYEIEGDTEGVVRRLFPTFTKMYDGIRSLALPDDSKK